MKSLLIVFSLMMAFSAHAFIGNVGHSALLNYDKTVATESIEKQFINVKANGAIGAGQVAAFDLTAKDGTTVVIAPVSGLAPACIMQVACASGALCKCQVYGPGSVAYDSTNAAATAGHKIIVSPNTAGYVGSKATDVATDVALGYFFDSASASATINAFINFL